MTVCIELCVTQMGDGSLLISLSILKNDLQCKLSKM